MAIKISSIEYTKGSESFLTDDITIEDSLYHTEPSGGKEPNDTVETAKFTANTEHGAITGEVTARRSGFEPNFEIEEVEFDQNDDQIEPSLPDCVVVDEN